MGSNTSKPSNDAGVHLQKSEVGADFNADPRSPTPEISRTPLQGKQGAKHGITKNADLRKTFENTNNGSEKLVHNNPILSAVIKNHLQSYDPRSPTQDFERTPIVICSKLDDGPVEENFGSPMLRKDEDENYDSCVEAGESPDSLKPKNLCNGFFDLTLNESIKEIDEPLGSSTASKELIESNISDRSVGKCMQLLETNFEFVDSEAEKFEECVDSDPKIELDPSFDGDFKHILQFKILPNDPRSPTVGIDRTPIVVAKTTADASDENVEEMSDDTLIKVLQNTNVDLRQAMTVTKTEGVLIYEDESNAHDFIDTPKKSKSGTSSGCRTPLSCMKNKADAGHMRSKSVNTLDDTKAQKTTSQIRRASHIPRLKSLTKPTKLMTGSSISLKNITKKSVISGDCENTPPHSHRDKWDKDSSIVL